LNLWKIRVSFGSQCSITLQHLQELNGCTKCLLYSVGCVAKHDLYGPPVLARPRHDWSWRGLWLAGVLRAHWWGHRVTPGEVVINKLTPAFQEYGKIPRSLGIQGPRPRLGKNKLFDATEIQALKQNSLHTQAHRLVGSMYKTFFFRWITISLLPPVQSILSHIFSLIFMPFSSSSNHSPVENHSMKWWIFSWNYMKIVIKIFLKNVMETKSWKKSWNFMNNLINFYE
jgi:hypothetical protein